MDSASYKAIDRARSSFRAMVDEWSARHGYLAEAQEKVRLQKGYDDYRIETSIVYNRALDDISPQSKAVKVVLVADNPGKNEQLARNNRYLVGQSGKLAEGWFLRELGMNFREEVLILNKTPIHTPKTAELKLLLKESGSNRAKLQKLLSESQTAMADLAWKLFTDLRKAAESPSLSGTQPGPWPVLWVSGLGELRHGGLFESYRDRLARLLMAEGPGREEGLWAFNHFSMNQFSIEVRKKARAGKPLLEELARIGAENAARVFSATQPT